MDVRDERRIEVAERLVDAWGSSSQVEDGASQDGVRQETDSVQLDQDGRVADVDEPCGRGYRVPARSRFQAESAAITSTASAIIRIAQTGS